MTRPYLDKIAPRKSDKAPHKAPAGLTKTRSRYAKKAQEPRRPAGDPVAASLPAVQEPHPKRQPLPLAPRPLYLTSRQVHDQTRCTRPQEGPPIQFAVK